METIKELANVDSQLWADGYNKCRKDVLNLIDELSKEADDSVMGMSRPEFVTRLKSKIQGK